MNSTAAPTYTPLECLLLFQTLVAYGAEEQDFERISTLLTHNDLVKDGETYDAQRLSPDALRQLYLQLLRDELRAGEDQHDDHTSRKRKLPTPPLPSVKDAQEYKEKLPLLVDRLYARYREYMVRAIREDEKRYAATQQEIVEIERGQWDERILKGEVMINGSVAGSPKVQVASGSQSQGKGVEHFQPSERNSHPPTRPDALAISNVLNSKDTPLSSPNAPESHRAQGFPPPILRTGSTGPHGPSPLQTGVLNGSGQSQSNHPGPGPQYTQLPPQGHYAGPQHAQQAQNYQWVPPYGVAPPFQPGMQYPPQYHPPYQQHTVPSQRPFSSPHGLPPPQPHVPSSPGHPPPHTLVLPPPNGIHRPSSSPAVPLNALADAAGQQYRAHSGSPMLPHGSPPLAGSPTMQHGPPPGHQYSPQQRPPSNQGPPYNGQQFMPYTNPPAQYQVTAQQRPPFQPQPKLLQSHSKSYNSPYHPDGTPRSNGNPHTPLSRPRLSTGVGTIWTPNPSAGTPDRFTFFESPAMEPLSPRLAPAKLPEKMTSNKKTPKKGDVAKPVQSVEKPKKEAKAKTQRRGGQRTRAGSTASSVIAGSYRSQSVMSHADELSLDNEMLNRHVKQEVATPIGVDDAGDTTADELPRHQSRSVMSSRQTTKRKRASSVTLEPRTPLEIRPSLPPSHVLWTRAFTRISSSALESIAGHKNASTFAAPVKVPGYTALILRPQDLKSIRSAIAQGHRAGNLVAPDDNAPSHWLPISEDLIPPKGIINYAQLEKELMRMFANAIMFNADPDRGLGRRWQDVGAGKGDIVGYEIDEDGVVKDTKAMFADVERLVGSLRSAERRSEEVGEGSAPPPLPPRVEDDDVDELAGDEHVGSTGTVKRRRLKT